MSTEPLTDDQSRDRCQACGRNWAYHDGIAATCAEVKRLRDALYAIYMAGHTLPDGRTSHKIENKRRWKIARDALVLPPQSKDAT
jgi:hypothetical protein